MTIITHAKDSEQKLKNLFKNLLESKARFPNKKIFKLKDGTSFYLPIKHDCIQQWIILHNEYFEQEEMDSIFQYIPQETVMLDIGANVGSHTLYFCNTLNATKVYAFDPNPEMVEIFKKNMELNKKDNVVITQAAVGESKGKSSLIINDDWKINRGGVRVKSDEKGEVDVISIDEFLADKEENIGFVKIDVEQFEKEVLNGMVKTIEKYKPVIYLEIYDKNIEYVFDKLYGLGYKFKCKVGGWNYLFVPK